MDCGCTPPGDGGAGGDVPRIGPELLPPQPQQAFADELAAARARSAGDARRHRLVSMLIALAVIALVVSYGE